MVAICLMIIWETSSVLFHKNDIYRYDIATDTLINLTNTPNLNEYNPHWISDNALGVSLKKIML